MKRFTPLGLALSLALAYPAVGALPQGAQVVQGQVAINPGLIQQASDKAIVNWQSFSIAAGETLRVQQPGVNSVLLNRVVGGDPSLILGQLQANGRVFLVNPRGIVFGRGSQVDVGGLVASTLDLSDTDFLASVYRFSAGREAGALQADGRVTAAGGTVALVAPQLSVAGSIEARRVGLAAAGRVQVDVEGDGLVLFNLRNDDDRDVALKFSGRVLAEGGAVGGSAELRAQARAGAAGQVLNMDGLVQARGLRQQGGRIVIDGGPAGITTVNGSVDASGDTGGSITVLGQKLALLDAARLDASGAHGGGSLQVGGGFQGQGTEHRADRVWIAAGAELRADATEQGDGGRVAVWAEQRTDMLGSIWARGGRLGGNGGMVETSGRLRLNVLGKVDASAPRGLPGQWLLDPNDLSIVPTGPGNSNVGAAPNFSSTDDSAVVDVLALNTALSGGTTVTVQTTNSSSGPPSTQSGNIDVQAAIVPTGAATLNLIALGNIGFSGGSIGAGAGALNVSLQAGGSITATTIDTGGGTLSASGAGAINLGTVTAAGLTINGGTGTVTLPGGSVTGALNVTTNGAIAQGGALSVGGFSTLSTGAAAVTLGSFDGHGLSVTTTGGAITLGTGTITGSLSATSGGMLITQAAGGLTVTGAAGLNAGAGAITLAESNDLAGTVTLTGAAAQIVSTKTSTRELKLGSSTLGGNLIATTGGGAITQSGTLTVSGTATLDAGSGAITLAGLSTGALTATTTAGNVVLGTGTVAALSASTGGSGTIGQASGSLAVTGAATLSSASGAITLGSFGSSGNVGISATSGAITLGTGNVGGTLTASTGGAGAITQAAGGLTASGLATLTAGSGGISLASFDSHGLAATATGGGVTLGTGTITGNLSATSGGSLIAQAAGGLTVTGTSTLNAGAGAITLNAANDLQGTVSLTGATATVVSSKTASSPLKLGSSTLSGNLIATTGGGAITQTGTLSAAGSATLNAAGGDITLGGFSSGSLSATTSGGALRLGTGTVTGTLAAATGGGAITQAAGGLTVTSTSSLNAGGGDVTLDQANDLHGAITLTGRAAQLTNAGANALTLASVNTSASLGLATGGGAIAIGPGSVTGTLTAGSSGGAITQTGTLSVSGLATLNAGAGSITLDRFGSGGLSATTAGGALTLGTGTLNGTLTAATAGGIVDQLAGGLIVMGNASIHAGSATITLNDAANDWRGTVALTGGATQLTSARTGSTTLTLGALATGNLTVRTAGGALNLGQGTVNGTLDAGSAGGAISQTGALSVSAVATLDATTAGNVTLADTGNQWHGVNLTGNALDLRSSGDISILSLTQPANRALTLSAGANLILGPAASIDTGTADLKLASLGGSFTVGGVLKGHDVELQAQSGLSLSQNLTATGNLKLTTASGGVTQTTGALLVTGTTTVAAGSSPISLAGTGNDFGGAVSLTGGATSITDLNVLTLGTLATGNLAVSATGALDLGKGTVAGTLNANSHGGTISQATGAGSGLTLSGATTLNAGTADITLTETGNDLAGAITATGGGVSLHSGHDLNLFALTQPANKALVLEALGTLTLPSGTTNIDTGTAALTLSSGGVFATFGTLKGGNITLKGQSATLAHDITASGNLDLRTTAGAINQTGGRLSVTGTSLFNAATFGITLNRPLNSFQGAVSLTGSTAQIQGQGSLTLAGMAVGSLTAQAGSALQLGTGTLSGALIATAGGAITQAAGGLRVTGTSSFSGSGGITLLDTANAWTGAVSLSGGAAQLRGSGAVVLGAGSLGSLVLTSGGAVSQSAAVTVNGALTVNAGGGAITLGNGGNQLNGTVTLTGAATQLSTGGALSLGTLSVGALTLQSSGNLNLGQGTIAGNLVANSGGGAVTQSGLLNVGGTASIQAGGGSITLTQGGNQWGGVLSLGGGAAQVTSNSSLSLGTLALGALTVDAAGTLGLGQGSVNGGLSASSHGGAITQSGALDVGGAANLQAGGGGITLTQAGNRWGGTVQLGGGAAQITGAGALRLGLLATGSLDAVSTGALVLGQGDVGGNLLASSGGGAITQAGALQVSGSATINAGAADVTLTNTGNRFLGPLSLTGNAVAIYNQPSLSFGTLSFNSLDATSNGSITLGSGSLSGALTARALGGSITQIAGGITVAGATTLQAAGGITLTQAANRLQGKVTLSGGATALTTAVDLSLGQIATGALTLNVGGALSFGAAGSVGGPLSAASGGAVTQAAALTVSGASSFDAGSAAITLGQSGNAFGGVVSLRGGSALLSNAGALRLGQLNVGDLKVSASGALQLGTGTVGGELKANSGGAAITQAAGGLAVGGTATLDAGSASIQLGDAGNAFAGLVNLNAGDVTLANAIALRLGSFTAHDLLLSAGGDLDLGAGSVGGRLSAGTRGSRIVQTGALTVQGSSTFIADGSLVDLVLYQPGNQLLGAIQMLGVNGGSFISASFSSALDLSFSGDVQTLTLASGGRLTLGGGRSTTLTAAARNGIVQTGALEVSGQTTLIARGGAAMGADLSHAGNDLNRVALQSEAGGSFGRVQLRDGDASSRHDGLRLGGDAASLELGSAGALDLAGGGYASLLADTSAAGAAITQSGALTVSGLTTLKAGSGSITLTRADNSLAQLAIGSAGVASLVSAGSYTVNASNVSTRLELGGPGAIALAGPLSGSGELVMSGSGSLTIATAHGYGGGTRVAAGRLVLQGPQAQPGSGAVQLGAAGQLDLRDGATLHASLVAQGGSVAASSGSGTLAGAVTLQADTSFLPGAGGLTVSGAISGQGAGLRLGSSGVLTLAGTNSYSGITDIVAGTLRATGAGALPATSAVQLAGVAELALGQDQRIGSLAGAGRVELGGFTLASGADGRDTGFSGSMNGSGGFTKLGSGRFALAGSGAYTGATHVAGGELVLASDTALNETTAVTVDAGALLTVQHNASLGSLAGAGLVDLQAARLGVGANGGSTRWDGTITGSGGLAKLGAGTFTLAGHNTLAGDLQVDAGTLQLDGGGVRPFAAFAALAAGATTGPVMPATAGINVAGGATLELLSDLDLGALTGGGQVLLNPWTLTLGASGRGGRFDGVIRGSGGLVKQGSGTLTLGGANLYTGSTLADGGMLVLDAPQALAGASALVVGAPAVVQLNAAQAVASLNGTGSLVLNGASMASGADGSDSRFDGVVSGSGGLIKQGGGVFTLTAANSHGGGTVIEAGAIRLTGQGSLGAGDVQNRGQLLLSRDDAFTLAPAVTGSGSLVITQGQVTLANAGNSYSGATQVLGGSLVTTAPERLPDASALQLAAGAQLQLGGNETLFSLQAAGSVVLAGNLTTRAEQVYTGSLALSNPAGITLAGTLIDASRSTNRFAGTPLGLSGGQALVTVKETLRLGDVVLSNGGRIEAERLVLEAKLQLSGGSLALVATAAPDDAKAMLLGTAQVPVAGQPLAVAEATVQQGAGGAITLAEAASLQVTAGGGGSVLLDRDANSFKGQLAVLSGAAYNAAWAPNVKGAQAVQSLVRVAGQQVRVGGGGIEADMVYIRADQLATAGGAALVARLPFDEIVLGRALSAPGMTLELAPGAFGLPGSFGAVNGQPVQIAVGAAATGGRASGPNAGYLTVLPKGGAQGATAVVLAGPKVGSVPAGGSGTGYRFFHDGASQATEIPVVYNGVLPLTPAASGAISSINGDAEDARRARFQETVRTENVTVRLRSGVIAEVGPGRASTQGSEGAKPPELCDPAEKPALSCKPSTPTP